MQCKEEGLNKKLNQLQTQLEYYKDEKERIGNICDELDEENQNLERNVNKLKAELEKHGKPSDQQGRFFIYVEQYSFRRLWRPLILLSL